METKNINHTTLILFLIISLAVTLLFSPVVVVAQVYEVIEQEEPNNDAQNLELLFDTNNNSENDDKLKRVFVLYQWGAHETLLQVLQTTTQLLDPMSPTTLHYDFPKLNSVVLTAPLKDLKLLKLNPFVLEIVDDHKRYPQYIRDSIKRYAHPMTSQTPAGQQETIPQIVPYGVEMVQAPQAWAQNARGAGVRVCVLDTGLDESHEDLNQNNVDGFEDEELNWDSDAIGHGTHVTGTIAAADNGIGVIGVAPDAEIYTVKVFRDDGSFDGGDGGVFIFSSGLIEAADECVNAQANIISMSLGGPIWNPIEFQHFSTLFETHGIISIAAAGNGGTFVPQYPASYTGVLGVGAVDGNKQIAPFSQRNIQVDLVAPGVDVLSLLPMSNGGDECDICERIEQENDGYGAISGTSMATPHVAGVAALLMSYAPDATSDDIVAAMVYGAEDLGRIWKDRNYGYGLISTEGSMEFLGSSGLLERGEECVSDQDCSSGTCDRWLLLWWRRTCG